jgi:hypothetical protein
MPLVESLLRGSQGLGMVHGPRLLAGLPATTVFQGADFS